MPTRKDKDKPTPEDDRKRILERVRLMKAWHKLAIEHRLYPTRNKNLVLALATRLKCLQDFKSGSSELEPFFREAERLCPEIIEEIRGIKGEIDKATDSNNSAFLQRLGDASEFIASGKLSQSSLDDNTIKLALLAWHDLYWDPERDGRIPTMNLVKATVGQMCKDRGLPEVGDHQWAKIVRILRPLFPAH